VREERTGGGVWGRSGGRSPQNTMKAASWREMSGEDLEQKVKDLTEELFNLRFQLSMGVAKNPSRVQQARRDLARAKTILRERQLQSAS
jgi:large subunit ribosomal protein L29